MTTVTVLTGIFGLPEDVLTKDELIYLQRTFDTNNKTVQPDITTDEL